MNADNKGESHVEKLFFCLDCNSFWHSISSKPSSFSTGILILFCITVHPANPYPGIQQAYPRSNIFPPQILDEICALHKFHLSPICLEGAPAQGASEASCSVTAVRVLNVKPSSLDCVPGADGICIPLSKATLCVSFCMGLSLMGVRPVTPIPQTSLRQGCPDFALAYLQGDRRVTFIEPLLWARNSPVHY